MVAPFFGREQGIPVSPHIYIKEVNVQAPPTLQSAARDDD
jgi:hypothetical protein